MWWWHIDGAWLWMVAFSGFVIWAILTVAGRASRGQRAAHDEAIALEILERRYARGEIDQEEFEERRRRLLRSKQGCRAGQDGRQNGDRRSCGERAREPSSLREPFSEAAERMRRSTWGLGLAGIGALAMVLGACGGGGGEGIAPATETKTPRPTPTSRPAATATPTATATETPTARPTPTVSASAYRGPTPSLGMGALSGRVLWNTEPMAGATVKLCGEVGFFSGCEDPGATATTGDDGVYMLIDVPPGEYALMTRLPGVDDWVYVTAGPLTARKYTVLADTAVDLGDFNTIRFDLVLNTPGEGATLSESAITLTWEPYAETAYYEVDLWPEAGEPVFLGERVEATTLSTSGGLRDCDYDWTVKAYNAVDQQIAEAERHFAVSGQGGSCNVRLVAPGDGATVSAGGIQLSWQPHPDAEYYLLHLTNETSGERVHDGTRVDATRYTITTALGTGQYGWYVAAYDAEGAGIGASDWWTFRVP